MKRHGSQVRRHLRLLAMTGVVGAAAIPATASAAQYAYVWAKPTSQSPVQLVRADVSAGTMTNPWMTNAAVTAGALYGFNPGTVSGNIGTPMAVSGDYIYFLNLYGGGGATSFVGRIDTTTNTSQPNWAPLTFSGGDIALSIAVKDNYIYLGTDQGKIARIGTDGNGFNGTYVSGAAPSGSYVASLRISGNTAYWASVVGGSTASLRSCAITTCTPSTIATGLSVDAQQGMGIAGGYALVPRSNGYDRVNLSSGNVDASWLTSPAGMTYFTSADGFGDVFYTSQTGSTGGDSIIARVSATSASPNADVATVGTVWSSIAGGDPLNSNIAVGLPSPPTISAITPSTGTTAGGTSVTITGSGFTGATGVTFGGVAAASFTVDSDTQITATTPAGSAGAVAIAVTTASGTDTEAGAFTYEAPATPSTPAASPATTPPTATQNETRSPLVTGNAGVDLVAPPTTTVKGETARVVTRMELEKVGRYTFLYEVDPGSAASSREMARAGSNRVPMLRGTRLGDRRLNTVHTAAVVNTTETGARLTTIALLKKAKVKPGMRLRVIHRAADGTLTESFIRSS